MAIRKPAWDLSREQIEAAARGLVLDRQHFAGHQPAARADSRSSTSAEIDQHIRQRMASMTAAEIMAINAAVLRGEDIASAVAKADSNTRVTGDGLRMTEILDGANRPIRTFENTGNRKVWMDRYRAEMFEQVKIWKDETPTPAKAAATEADWRELRRQVASGRVVNHVEI